jgi:hypothetical protein
VILERSEEIRNFPRRQAHWFDVSGQHSTNPVENGPEEGQEGNSVSVVVGLIAFGMAVEGTVDLPLVVPITSEDVLQELQLRMQAVLIT